MVVRVTNELKFSTCEDIHKMHPSAKFQILISNYLLTNNR